MIAGPEQREPETEAQAENPFLGSVWDNKMKLVGSPDRVHLIGGPEECVCVEGQVAVLQKDLWTLESVKSYEGIVRKLIEPQEGIELRYRSI